MLIPLDRFETQIAFHEQRIASYKRDYELHRLNLAGHAAFAVLMLTGLGLMKAGLGSYGQLMAIWLLVRLLAAIKHFFAILGSINTIIGYNELAIIDLRREQAVNPLWTEGEADCKKTLDKSDKIVDRQIWLNIALTIGVIVLVTNPQWDMSWAERMEWGWRNFWEPVLSWFH